MLNPYERCPKYENENYLLRMVSKKDKEDLLKVYSDEKAVPFFNSDNCGEMTFIILLKIEWNKQSNIGCGSMIDKVLFVGLLYQK